MCFFTGQASTEIYTLSLHDALPIFGADRRRRGTAGVASTAQRQAGAVHQSCRFERGPRSGVCARSEEHTSELQSRGHLVCRLLLEKKNKVPRSQSQSNDATAVAYPT